MAAAIAMAALGGLQILTGLQQADLIRQSAALNNEIAAMNAEAAEQDSFNAIADGMTTEARYQSSIDSIVEFQRTAYLAQDVDASFGTARDVQEQSKLNGFLNKVDIQNAAYDRAMGYKNEARNIRLNAILGDAAAKLQSNSVRNASIINGITTGVSGYAKYGDFGGSGDSNPKLAVDRSGTMNAADSTGYLGNYKF